MKQYISLVENLNIVTERKEKWRIIRCHHLKAIPIKWQAHSIVYSFLKGVEGRHPKVLDKPKRKKFTNCENSNSFGRGGGGLADIHCNFNFTVDFLFFTSIFYMFPKKWGANSMIFQFFIICKCQKNVCLGKMGEGITLFQRITKFAC